MLTYPWGVVNVYCYYLAAVWLQCRNSQERQSLLCKYLHTLLLVTDVPVLSIAGIVTIDTHKYYRHQYHWSSGIHQECLCLCAVLRERYRWVSTCWAYEVYTNLIELQNASAFDKAIWLSSRCLGWASLAQSQILIKHCWCCTTSKIQAPMLL